MRANDHTLSVPDGRANETTVNPYAPVDTPADPDKTAGPQNAQQFKFRDTRVFLVKWTLVMSASCLVPLFFSAQVVRGTGAVGMISALVVFLMIGAGFGIGCKWRQRALMRGATLVAFSQAIPILQMMAGILAIEATASLGLMPRPNDELPLGLVATFPAGFICTLLCGAFLFGLALVLGTMWTAITSFFAK